MPVLHQYAEESKKDGFYILANVGAGNPITLQVTPIAARIFDVLNYSNESTVPTKIVWAMYDLDMLYTKTSLNASSIPDGFDPATVISKLDLDNKLDDTERSKLVAYLEGYSGPEKEKMEQLRYRLLNGISGDQHREPDEEKSNKELQTPPEVDIPESPSQITEILEDWTDDSLTESAQNAFLLHEDFVSFSIRSFSIHPHLSDTPIVAIANNEITYDIDPSGTDREVRISDARGHSETIGVSSSNTTSFDFRIDRRLFDGTTETAYIQDGIIRGYESDGDRGSRTMLSYDLDSILPPERSYIGKCPKGEVRWLREELLSLPSEEIEERLERWGTPIPPEERGEWKMGSDGPFPGIPDEVIETINNHREFAIVEIDRQSNSGNLVAEVKSNMVIITDNVSGSSGDWFVVRSPDGFHDNMQVSQAVKLDQIPTDNTEDWLESKL